MFWQDHIHPESEPKSIQIIRGDWTDENRQGRKIPYKIYLPKEVEKPLPVVFWSHGLGGGRDGAGFLARYLAAHDYAVVNLQHTGTDIGLWMGKQGHPWDVIRSTKIGWDATEARFFDVPFALDQLFAGNSEKDVHAYMDLSNIGMSGHSYGAMTTQVMAGQHYGPEGSPDKNYGDERFKAFIAYSQMPHWGDDADHGTLYKGIGRPIFFMTGTDDISPIRGEPYHKRLKLFEHAPAEIKHSLVLNGGDHMVFAGSRGQLPGYDKISDHENIIKIGALAWWDWHLKGDQAAREFLEDEARFKAFIGQDAAHNFS